MGFVATRLLRMVKDSVPSGYCRTVTASFGPDGEAWRREELVPHCAWNDTVKSP